jgi:hypothetical protein
MVRSLSLMRETFVILWFCTFICFSALAKKNYNSQLGKTKVDSLYREDQFYLGLNYNTFKQTQQKRLLKKILLGV